MSEPKFELCERALPGLLQRWLTISGQFECFYAAADVEKMLEQAPIVYQYKGRPHADWSHEIDEDFGGIKKYLMQGRVLLIEPIEKPDTAEGLLKEYMEWFEKADGVKAGLQSRARKFLEKS